MHHRVWNLVLQLLGLGMYYVLVIKSDWANKKIFENGIEW